MEKQFLQIFLGCLFLFNFFWWWWGGGGGGGGSDKSLRLSPVFSTVEIADDCFAKFTFLVRAKDSF